MKTNENLLKRNNLENKIILILGIIFLLILFIFAYLSFTYYSSVLEKKAIYARFILSDHYGIEINGSALAFGMTVPGGTSSKELNVVNNYEKDVKVQFLIEGDIKNFMKVSENNFILKKNESRKVNFAISAPLDGKYGVYEGKVIVIIRRV